MEPIGLFDYVRCEYPLPLPKEASEIDLPDWATFDFQVRSLILSSSNDEHQFMGIDSYNIDEEGEIYRDVVERSFEETEDGYHDIKEINNGIEKVEYTGELNITGFHMAKEHDCFMEFKFLFWKGEVKEVSLVDWKKEDNTERVKKQKELEKKLEKAYTKKNSGFRSAWNKVIKSLFLIVKYLIGVAFKIVFKLERWFSF